MRAIIYSGVPVDSMVIGKDFIDLEAKSALVCELERHPIHNGLCAHKVHYGVLIGGLDISDQ